MAPTAFLLEPTSAAPQKSSAQALYPMNHSAESPKLPKIPFIIGDLVLIGVAGFIAYRSSNPISPNAMLAITVCVVLGAAFLIIPFLANYARRQDALLTERQNQIAALARTTAESAEQISIAVAGIHTLVSSIPKPKADTPVSQTTDDPLNRRLAQLDATAKAQNDAHSAREKALAAALSHATRQIELLVAATTQATTAARSSDLPASAAPLPPPPSLLAKSTPLPAELIEPPSPLPTEPVADDPAPAEIATTSVPTASAFTATTTFTPASPHADEVPVDDVPKQPKPTRTRKPKPAEADADLGLEIEAPEPMASAASTDGVTRLIVTAYIGIGHKLYLRGEGPGLSWDKGVPLQFVSIGKWRWESTDATAPITAKLFKNDQVECVGLGSLTLEPGRQHEVNAGF